MSHVDEGQIHAYLDRQLEFAETEARVRLEAHIAECAECATRLEENRRLHERASALLAASEPDGIEAPPFTAITGRANRVAKRGLGPRRTPLQQLGNYGLAASIVLALAVGWYVRVQPEGGAETADRSAPESPAAPAVGEEARAQSSDVAGGPPPITPTSPAREAAEPPARPPQTQRPTPTVAPPRGIAARQVDRARSLADSLVARPDSLVAADVFRDARAARPRDREPAAASGIIQPQPSAAGAGRTITGTVRAQETRAPVSGVEVSVPGTDLSTVTGADGRFRLPEVPAGSVAVRASRMGYEAEQDTVVARDGDVALDLVLRPSLVALDELAVTSDDADRASAAERARHAQQGRGRVQLRGAASLTPPDAVTLAEAERRLGERLGIIPGLDVVEVLLFGGVTDIATVRQRVGTVILDLVHVQADSDFARAVPEESPQVAFGRFIVTAVADLPRDSLVALLGRLRAAPDAN